LATFLCLFKLFLIHGNYYTKEKLPVNYLTAELNPSSQRCLPNFLLGILIYKGLTARRLYKAFGLKELNLSEGVSYLLF
jgi:hypothetical protein